MDSRGDNLFESKQHWEMRFLYSHESSLPQVGKTRRMILNQGEGKQIEGGHWVMGKAHPVACYRNK